VPFVVVGTTEILASFSPVGILGVYSSDEKYVFDFFFRDNIYIYCLNGNIYVANRCWLIGDFWIWSFIGPFFAIHIVKPQIFIQN